MPANTAAALRRDHRVNAAAPVVAYGDRSVLRVPRHVHALGATRVLLVCGRTSFEASGAAAMLPGLESVATVRRWSDFVPNTDSADLRTGRPCGMEALLRWKHPERGLIRPDEILPVLEATGLTDLPSTQPGGHAECVRCGRACQRQSVQDIALHLCFFEANFDRQIVMLGFKFRQPLCEHLSRGTFCRGVELSGQPDAQAGYLLLAWRSRGGK